MSENRTRRTDDRDDVATLVRLAGKRQAVPRDRAARVRTAARAEWRHAVRRRTRRRRAWTAAGLAAAASLALALAVTLRILPLGTGAPTAADAPILVEALAGPAWTRPAADREGRGRKALETGDTVEVGSDLTTAGDGRAAIRLASGHSVRLDASTSIRLLEGGSIALDRGAVYVDSGSGTPPPLEVRTALGTIEEIGTQFEVRLEDRSVHVRLREGAVVVRHDDLAHRVEAGTGLELELDGSVTRRAIAAHGPEWGWIVGITPMPDLEGRSARAFLEWAARERGWTLAFADENVARSAGETVLGGTVERLTLEEALDAVLPACRLTHRVENGILVVGAAPEERPVSPPPL